MEELFERRPNNEYLLEDLKSLDLSSSELAHRLKNWGDYRNESAILRSIQRMKSGESPVSAEMQVIINMLKAQQHHLDEFYSDVKWKESASGYAAIVGQFTVDLVRKSKARWQVNVRHNETGYCAPWPVWQETLSDAKRKALVTIEDTKAHFETYE